MEDGHITGAGYSGRGYISCTRVGCGPQREVTFQPAEFPEIRTQPDITATGARFTQTTGGRTGAPMPRPVAGRPYVQWVAPALERQLSATIMRGGANPAIRKLANGTLPAGQGRPGDDIYLLLDGVLSVWVDGTQVAWTQTGELLNTTATTAARRYRNKP